MHYIRAIDTRGRELSKEAFGFSNNEEGFTIDDITKVKYHKWLNEQLHDLQLPESEEEENLDSQSDSKYESVTKHLRIYANSHREQFPRVYQELKKYNYWRNLYGCKWYALSIYAILAIREILMVDKFGIADIFRNPVPKYTMLLVLVVWSILFCSIVSQKTVKGMHLIMLKRY